MVDCTKDLQEPSSQFISICGLLNPITLKNQDEI